MTKFSTFLDFDRIFLICLSFFVVLTFFDILKRNWSLKKEQFYNLAFAICIIYFGEFTRQGLFLITRYMNYEWNDMMKFPFIEIYSFSILIIAVGTACLLRIFSYDRYGNWPWVLAIGVSTVVTALLSFY